MSFAALEARANASVLKHLANCSVIIDGSTVPGIFKKPYTKVAYAGEMADSRPTVSIATNAVPANPEGQAILVDGVAYVISEHQPDGTGLSVLPLELT